MRCTTTGRTSSRSATLALLALLVVFAAEARAVMINWTPVGTPGNANDPADGDLNFTAGIQNLGAVPYAYNIDKYDVTSSEYVEFLNAKDPTGANTLGLYNGTMSNATYGGISYSAGNAIGSKYGVMSGDGNHPVNAVSWYDTVRFANWLNNGQGTGDTESGAYTLLGGTPTPSNANSITRNVGATVFIPSENEWYKAAYYNPANNSYYQYPTSSDLTPTATAPTATPNSANYNAVVGNLTNVGAYSGTTSPYGAFDMGGNVWQWNEALISGSYRSLRGGMFNAGSSLLLSSFRNIDSPTNESLATGFRVVNIPEGFVPEPSTGVLAIIACGLMWWWRKRFK